MELVSVVMPTFKRHPKMVSRAVTSVLSQTYPNIELIIVDDSPQNSLYREDIKRYIEEIENKQVILIQHEKNKGANAARNTGIKHAKGDFIAFLDDDDEWISTKIEEQIMLFDRKDIGMVYCSTNNIYTILDSIQKTKVKKAEKKGFIFDDLMNGNVIGSTSGVIMRKECFEKVGNFDINLRSAQDYEMYLRISQKYYVDYVKGKPLLNYYIHEEDRITGSYSRFQESRDYIQQKYLEVFGENKKLYSDFLFSRALVSIKHKDYEQAWKYAIQANNLHKSNLLKYSMKILVNIGKSYIPNK